MKKTYQTNKIAIVGTSLKCPSCNTTFIKTHKQQAFCASKSGTVCKDKYWNTVTPTKRNNKTRISPASAMWVASQGSGTTHIIVKHYRRYDDYDEHPFSSAGLGQWDD